MSEHTRSQREAVAGRRPSTQSIMIGYGPKGLSPAAVSLLGPHTQSCPLQAVPTDRVGQMLANGGLCGGNCLKA